MSLTLIRNKKERRLPHLCSFLFIPPITSAHASIAADILSTSAITPTSPAIYPTTITTSTQRRHANPYRTTRVASDNHKSCGGSGHGSSGKQKRREYWRRETGGWLRGSRSGSEAAEADVGNRAEQKKRRVSADSPPDWHWSG